MRRKVVIGLLAAGAVALALPWLPRPAGLFSSQLTHSREAAPPEKTAESAKAEERFAALPARAPLGQPRGALFGAPPPPPKPVAVTPVPESKPLPPPLPYRVAGKIAHDGVAKIVLARGDRLITVAEGDTLEGGYRVESVGSDEITLVYLPLGMRERLPLASTASAPAPASAPAGAGGSLRSAQLRWDGPERVQAGNVFNLALKLSSNEPLRAAPLQLSYDPQLLEAVAVRPGKFFAEASFSYRIVPSGSIFVGASGGSAPAGEGELVVVTFKPIRPAAAAEVKVASLQLQGAAGTPVGVEPLSAFRTAITP